MSASTSNSHHSSEGYRRTLAARLRENAAELEEQILDRLSAIERAAAGQEPGHLRGLQKVIRPAVEYGIAAVELGESRCPPPPPAAIAHARAAAWESVGLQVLLNRYQAGYSVFNDLLLRESELGGGVRNGVVLRQIFQSNAIAFERLNEAVGKEHESAQHEKGRSSETRRLERIQGLLSGELLDAPDLAYDFTRNHIGLIGSGDEVAGVVRKLARTFDGQLLMIHPSPNKVWAWIGTCAEKPAAALEDLLRSEPSSTTPIALGETASGLGGWHKSHRQAEAALAVAGEQRVVSYADVAVLAAILKDDLLREFLEDHYLAPLSAGRRDGGKALFDTVRAYFAAEWQAVSASEALSVKRHTVRKRIDTVEEILGCSLKRCATELDLALRLQSLNSGGD